MRHSADPRTRIELPDGYPPPPEPSSTLTESVSRSSPSPQSTIDAVISLKVAAVCTGYRADMTRTRWITEMGMGVDVHGNDYTKAARRAVSDALRHSSLNFFDATGKSREDMYVDVRIGVADPEAVDIEAVSTEVPYGTVTVSVQLGGLDVPSPSGNDGIVIANAAIVVSFD